MHVKLMDVLKSNKSPKEKWAHVWEYYKIHIAAIVILLLLYVSFTISMLNKKETVLSMAVYGAFSVTYEVQEEMQTEMDQLVINGDGKQQILVQTFDSESVTEQQKFVAMLVSKEFDIFILTPEAFKQFDEDGLFAPANRYVKEAQADFLGGEDSQKTGIPISYFPILAKQLQQPELIVTMHSKSEHVEFVQQFFEEFYERD